MAQEDVVGQIVGGTFGELLIRKKRHERIQLGEILVVEDEDGKHFIQVYDIKYSSQLSQQNLEMISGLQLEEANKVEILDEHIRNYTLAIAKSILYTSKQKTGLPKSLPSFMKRARRLRKEDVEFLTKPEKSLYMGKLRSGDNTINVPFFLDGEKVMSHHILLAATTGRGKSNLTSVLLWDLVEKGYAGTLVLDPHDEYFKSSKNKPGLEEHPNKDNVVYYSKNPERGGNTLIINLKELKPKHFSGVINLSDPQKDALYYFFSKYNKEWVIELFENKETPEGFHESSINVLRRKLSGLLEIREKEGDLTFGSIFQKNGGESTIGSICASLEEGKTVIIDTSLLSSSQEIFAGSIIASKILERYSHYKRKSTLREKPVISIILEEAPRVIGKEALEAGPNVFSQIAREGRKFRVGLYAITQLPSLIPTSILANMNTKIIMGIEMKSERQSLIESCPQDLSEEGKNIAALDKGEAIISSTFSRFALPVKIPLIDDFVKEKKKDKPDNSFKKGVIGM